MWPNDHTEVHRILQKYKIKSAINPPTNYDICKFLKDKKSKVVAETSKVNQTIQRMLYPIWDDSFDSLTEEELQEQINSLYNKLKAIDERINMLKTLPLLMHEPKAVDTSWAATSQSHLNFAHKSESQVLSMPTALLICGNNQLGAYPIQLDEDPECQMLHHLDPNYDHLIAKNNGIADWTTNQVSIGVPTLGNNIYTNSIELNNGAFNNDPNLYMLKEFKAENNSNSSVCYYNGGVQLMQPDNCYPAINDDPNFHMLQEDKAENNTNSSVYYYHGGVQPMQPYNYYPALQTNIYPSQDIQYGATKH